MKKYFFLLGILVSLSALAQRDSVLLADNWYFSIDKDSSLSKKYLNPSAYKVKLPHTWNVDSVHQQYYGSALYQKEITIPVKWKGKRIKILFGAINHTSYIYLNGKKIHENIGDGYSKFYVDISEYVLFGKKNLLSVSVNNAYTNHKVPFSNSFDWPNDGGLIRNVYLIKTEKSAAEYVHVKASVTTPFNEGKLELKMSYDILPKTPFEWKVKVTEESQKTANIVFEKLITPISVGQVVSSSISISNINLWHFDHPNLYKINITVLQKGKIIDQISTTTGFREILMKDGKFYLNGESIRLMGVEWTAGSNPNYGLAEPKEEIIRYSKLMKDVNCIFSRQHFQQDDSFYEFCDRNGILVHQEIPLWGPETPSDKSIQEIAFKQLDRMINNFYNHPSIFAWGVGNELSGRDERTKKFIGDMIDKARALYPSRYAGYVSNTLTHGFRSSKNFTPDAAAHGDYIMMNEYGGSWWDLPTGQIHEIIDSIHVTYPDKPFFISEFGLCEPNFKGGDQRRLEDLVYHMAVYETKPYILGAIYFDLTDYRTHYPGTNEENKYRRRIHGVYDMYGSPKPSMVTLREHSSPIEIQQTRKEGKGTSVLIFGNIGLPQHKVKGYTLYVSETTEFGKGISIELPEIKPGQKLWINVPGAKGQIVTVVRPTGYIASQKTF